MTIALILINTAFHIALPERTKDFLAFPPCHFESWVQIPMGFFLHAFIHADWSHLTGNMLFLWVFGNTLETRIGHARFLAIYMACIAASAIFYYLLAAVSGSMHCGIGASGAISGIMGVFAVRCYFARVTVGLPFLFLPLLTVPLRIQALALIGLFFALDTAGSRAMFGSTDSNIGYWAHTGGYLFGFSLAFFLRFHRQAAEESVGVRADRLRQNEFGKREAADVYRDILEKEPDNIEALTFFLDFYKYNSHKRPYIFSMLIKALTARDMKQAVALFDDFYPKHLNLIPGATALKLGLHYYQAGELQKARNCLETAMHKSGPWQAKATLFLGRTFEGMGETALAEKYYCQTRTNFPGTPFAQEAGRKG